jgi:hypothetical protein
MGWDSGMCGVGAPLGGCRRQRGGAARLLDGVSGLGVEYMTPLGPWRGRGEGVYDPFRPAARSWRGSV